MPKYPPIPQISVVIPIENDMSAFESTLVSVLENRPAGCEVIVAHDGSYDDPFDLADEVGFAQAATCQLADLAAAGALQARGQLVHLLGSGVRATRGWLDDVIECFEPPQVGLVAPVIRQSQTGEILAAGWHDAWGRRCTAVASGCCDLDASDHCDGAYLPASFWRRELIRSLSGVMVGGRAIEASYAFGLMLRSAGWQTAIAGGSLLEFDRQELPWDRASFGQGRHLQAIHDHLCGRSGWANATKSALTSVASGVVRPDSAWQSFGQAMAPLSARWVVEQLGQASLPRYDQHDRKIVKLPTAKRMPARRAA